LIVEYLQCLCATLMLPKNFNRLRSPFSPLSSIYTHPQPVSVYWVGTRGEKIHNALLKPGRDTPTSLKHDTQPATKERHSTTNYACRKST
jgi:hypothetical protein